ncbi:MAG TPA: CRTAC1 family protein [Terriglobales bacterium]|nr:CRTAC1 family protein [Terriglobales bacterium]
MLATSVPFSLVSRLAQATSEEYPFELVPPSVSGISWIHRNGRSPDMYPAETVGAGCGFFDYDNDGWMDIYLVNSGKCDFFDPHPPLRNALYKNNRDGTFTDVTQKAGVPGGGYGMGVAAADYDGNGWTDLLVTQYNGVILYRNNGDGTFTDVTKHAGLPTEGWATSAVWFDYDNDGKLDLFICRFVDFDKTKNKFCGDRDTGLRYYCTPRVYDPAPSWLFHNNGDGTFTDVSQDSGIAKSLGKAWGAVACDINNDGLLDLFVGNDTVANFLFVNSGNGKFREMGIDANVGFSAEGHTRSGMGVDAADYDQDGWMDLFVSNIDQEMYSLYHNNHDESFDDLAIPNGIAKTTKLMSGWGVKFFDYDNDGNLDLFLANGHPDDKIEQHSTAVRYLEPLLLFRGNGKGFENVSIASGPIFQKPYAARGMAVGDFNNDGALDVLVGINNGAPLLLKNQAGKRNHWVGLTLVAKRANPESIGAVITWQSSDLKRSYFKTGGGSYLASHDPRVVLGVGQRTRVDWIEIKWPAPSQRRERFTNIGIDRYTTVVEGEGQAS